MGCSTPGPSVFHYLPEFAQIHQSRWCYLIISFSSVPSPPALSLSQHQFSSVQLLSRVWFFVTPWIAAHEASLSITSSQSFLKLMSIEWVMPPKHLILCHPLLLPPSIFPSIRVFSNELVLLIRWPNYWHFSFSISPSNGYSGLISFRMDWLDLLAVQGTLRSILQHHSSKASVLLYSAFFMAQLFTLVQDYWKNHNFDYTDFSQQSDVSVFNMLPRFVIVFLPLQKGKKKRLSF